ncbi:uncharacterized protein [Haliotis cracherodii]|uniref:uncharacterized protein n=1 Tax=Haliotis cracherodii TaxID=6455 RepID=UPI0039ED0C94
MTFTMTREGCDDPTKVCLFHDKRWRNRFQFFINQIRVEIVPVINLAKFQKLVCTCEGQDPETFPKDFDKVLSEFSIRDIPPKEAREFVKYLYRSDIWKTEQNRSTSAKNLIYLLQCSLQQDFGLIDGHDSRPDAANPTKWTSTTVRFTVKKFEPHFMGFFIGIKGRNIRTVERKFKCKIRLKAEFVSSQGCGIAAVIEYLSSKPVTLEDISQCLEKEANRIVVEREYCQRKTLEYYRKKSERRHRTFRPKDAYINEKTASIRKYKKRMGASRKHHHVRQVNVSKLEGSRCLNCLVSYTTPLFKDARCTHHPGYIVAEPLSSTNGGKKKTPNHRWTCCSLVTQTSHVTMNEHTETGCTVGLHNWRPDRKQEKGDMKSKIMHLE